MHTFAILSELLKFENFFKNKVERIPILRSMRTFLTKMKLVITKFEVNTTTIRLWCCFFTDHFNYSTMQNTHHFTYYEYIMYIADFVIEPDGLNKVAQKVEHNFYRFILNN